MTHAYEKHCVLNSGRTLKILDSGNPSHLSLSQLFVVKAYIHFYHCIFFLKNFKYLPLYQVFNYSFNLTLVPCFPQLSSLCFPAISPNSKKVLPGTVKLANSTWLVRSCKSEENHLLSLF